MSQVENLEFLAKRFKNLNETKQNQFTKIALRLLNETFLIKAKESDRNDYYESSELKEELENFFAILNYSFHEDKILQIVYIKTEDNKNRMHLTKFETVILLSLRVAYFNSSKKSSLIDVASISYEELKQSVLKTNIFKDDKSTNEYQEALKKLRRFKVIDYKGGRNFVNDSRIFIYPSIAYVVKVDDIVNLDNLIKAYNKEENKDEEINED